MTSSIRAFGSVACMVSALHRSVMLLSTSLLAEICVSLMMRIVCTPGRMRASSTGSVSSPPVRKLTCSLGTPSTITRYLSVVPCRIEASAVSRALPLQSSVNSTPSADQSQTTPSVS